MSGKAATRRVLDHAVRAYRIGDPNGKYPIFDATGSKLAPGRWNTPTSPVIYASLNYSTAILEKLVHGSGRLPPNQHYIELTIPPGVACEAVVADGLPGWDSPTMEISRAYGQLWSASKRSLILLVPSVVARVEQNVLINPEHRDFSKVGAGRHIPVLWDARLFKPRPIQL